MRCLILILISLMGISSAAAERIVNDDGGRIADYVAKYTRARDAGERIVVDGSMFVGLYLGAGASSARADLRDAQCIVRFFTRHGLRMWQAAPLAIRTQTELMWKMYPQRIRNWIRRATAGLGERMIYLRGRPLAAMYPACLPRTRSRRRAVIVRRRRSPRSVRSSTARSLKREHSQASSFSR